MHIQTQIFTDDGSIPNNEQLPVILYKAALAGTEAKQPERYENLFHGNNWGNSWRNGVFGFHHYHSNAHEVLGIYGGWAEVLLGGEEGRIFKLEAGDVVVLPAGTGHKNINRSGGFKVVGAYPDGQSPDMNYGKPDERPAVLENIRRTKLPSSDPVQGADGTMFDYWSRKGSNK